MQVVSAPHGNDNDPLAGLPVADATSSVLIPSFDHDATAEEQQAPQLQLVDLASRHVAGIDDYAYVGDVAFTAGGDAVWVAGDRAVGVRDRADGHRRIIGLPDEAAGAITSMQTINDLIVVTVGRRSDANRRTLLFGVDGTLRCAVPEGNTYTMPRYGLLWSEDEQARLDPATCAVTTGLRVPSGTELYDFVVDDSNAYVTAFEQPTSQRAPHPLDRHRVYRFDVASGEQRAASRRLPADPTALAIHGHQLWVIAGTEVRRLDADHLDELGSVGLPHDVAVCDGDPRFVRHEQQMYLLDDCSGALYLLDGATASAVRGWTVPNDGNSDIQINTTSNADGIWMVDEEQTSVPYLFDVAQRRFERLPDSVTGPRTLVAIPWAVYPDPSNGQ